MYYSHGQPKLEQQWKGAGGAAQPREQNFVCCATGKLAPCVCRDLTTTVIILNTRLAKELNGHLTLLSHHLQVDADSRSTLCRCPRFVPFRA